MNYERMKAMIFSAGVGSRLKPLTNTIPKALVKVQGKTLLEYNIERIKDFGIKDIVVNVHHFADQVIDFLHKNNNFGVNIHISDELDKLLDTGGGLSKVSKKLSGTEPILLQNVDIYSNISYKKMLGFHKKNNALVTLAVRNRSTSRYLKFNNNRELCGWENISSGEKIDTKKAIKTEMLAFSGIHIIESELLSYLQTEETLSIIKLYLELSVKENIMAYEHNTDFWFDVGTKEKLESLNLFLQNNDRNQ